MPAQRAGAFNRFPASPCGQKTELSNARISILCNNLTSGNALSLQGGDKSRSRNCPKMNTSKKSFSRGYPTASTEETEHRELVKHEPTGVPTRFHFPHFAVHALRVINLFLLNRLSLANLPFSQWKPILPENVEGVVWAAATSQPRSSTTGKSTSHVLALEYGCRDKV